MGVGGMMWNYKNLEVWKRAHELMKNVYKVIDAFPEKERYNAVFQIRKAVFSVPSNIVEGSGKDTNKDFAHYLDNAIGSLKEVEYQIFASWELGYVGEEKYKELKKEMTIFGMKLRAYRRFIGGGEKK
ncbi:MAG: four helix bundle protein [archaeon]